MYRKVNSRKTSRKTYRKTYRKTSRKMSSRKMSSRKMSSRKMSSRKMSSRKMSSRKMSSRKVKFNMFRNKLSNLDPNMLGLIASNLDINERRSLGEVVKSDTNVGLNPKKPRMLSWIGVKTVKLPEDSSQEVLNSIFKMALDIKELDLSNCRQILTLNGIENLENLESLILDNTKVMLNITALLNNDRIKKLSYKFAYPDMDTIGTLRNLEELDLSHPIRLHALDKSRYNGFIEENIFKLTNLKKLNLSHIKIEYLFFINDLTNLEELNLGSTEIKSMQHLNLPKLKKLDISFIPLSDHTRSDGRYLNFINDLTNLEEINLYETNLLSAAPLSNLPKLKKIYVGPNFSNYARGLVLNGVDIIRLS